MPTIFGIELEDGHDLGLDATPLCCYADMDGKDTPRGGREYTCGGLVSEIFN